MGSNQVVHILVGHSIVIQTESRLKRVLVANPAVVSTSTTAPNELVITAASPGSSSVIIWHENGQSRILDIFADVDVAMLRESIQKGFPTENVQVDAEEGRVVLTGAVSSQAVADQIAKMAGAFAKPDLVNSLQVLQRGRQKQVLLKVRFAEVDRSKFNALGINILSTGAGNTIGTISTGQFGGFSSQAGISSQIGARNKGFSSNFSVSDLLNIFVFRPDLNLGATIRDLQTKNVLQILAEPNLMAASGESARFLAGGELPYPLVQPGTGGQNTVSITFRPFGVKLDFTGTIDNDNVIRLKVAPEVSSLDYANAVSIGGFSLPALSTRRAETVVDLKDGQSFGIAGLLDERTTQQLSKVPGIGDVPIIGLFFRSKSLTKSATELVVLVTPTIVDPLAAPPAAPEVPKAPIAPLNPTEFDKKEPGIGRQ